MTPINWRFGRHVFVASSLCAYGVSSSAVAEEPKDKSDTPAIFSILVTGTTMAASPARSPVPTTFNNDLNETMSQKIAEALSKFDPTIAGRDVLYSDKTPALDGSKPVLMETFTVFDTRLPEFSELHESELEKVLKTGSVFRHDGKTFSSELTFLDLAEQYHWKAFSLQPPPAISIRFTISW